MARVLLVGNTNVIQVKSLKTKASGTFLNAATVTAVVRDLETNDLMGSVTLTYTDGSNGDYSGNLNDDAGLVAGRKYRVTVAAVEGSTKGLWEFTIPATANDLS